MAKSKKHFTTTFPVRASSLLNGMRRLIVDVGTGIQYNHIPPRTSVRSLVSLHRRLGQSYFPRIVRDIFANRMSIQQASDHIKKELASTTGTLRLVEQALQASRQGTISNMSFKLFGTTFYLNTESSFSRNYCERLLTFSANNATAINELFEANFHQFPVPKNSDKATSEFRVLRVKPLFAEWLLTSLLCELAPIINSDKVQLPENIHLFGTTIDVNNEFTNYIEDYDTFQGLSYRLRDTYKFVKYADFKKYFDTIPHKLIADALAEIYRLNGRSGAAFVRKNFIAFVMNMLQNEDGSSVGITIESHTQHALANIAMAHILTTRLKAPDSAEITIYVDDVFIYSDSPIEIEMLFEDFSNIISQYGMSFAENKTSEVLPLSDGLNHDKFKELIRLPGVAYFDILNGSQINASLSETGSTEKNFLIGELKREVICGKTGYELLDYALGDILQPVPIDCTGVQRDAILGHQLGQIASRIIDKADSFISLIPDTGNHPASQPENTIAYPTGGVSTNLVFSNTAMLLSLTDNEKFSSANYISNFFRTWTAAATRQFMLFHKIPRTLFWTQAISPAVRAGYDCARCMYTSKNSDSSGAALKFKDIVFAISNRADFEYTVEKGTRYLDLVHQKDESQILNALQYFYLQSISTAGEDSVDMQERLTWDFVRQVIVNFPSKIKFAAAIIKNFSYRKLLMESVQIADGINSINSPWSAALHATWLRAWLHIINHDWKYEVNSVYDIECWFEKLDIDRKGLTDPDLIRDYYFTYRLFGFTLTMN